jgi:hypothetical protein
MEIQVSKVSVIHISLSETEAQVFIADATPLQQQVYELLFPINLKTTKAPKSKRAPKAAARKGGKQTKSSGTLICTTCGRAFKYRAYFNRHVAQCLIKSDAGTAAAS